MESNNELILLVDDDENIRRVIKLILENNNYRILEAKDGREAVERFRQHITSIDLVLTDMALPHMNGIAVISAINQMKPGMRFIAFSGKESNLDFSELDGLNIRLLGKPYDTGKLLQTVRDALAGEVK